MLSGKRGKEALSTHRIHPMRSDITRLRRGAGAPEGPGPQRLVEGATSQFQGWLLSATSDYLNNAFSGENAASR